MNGANLVGKIRRILRDNEDLRTKGEFWSDDELVLCLNAAQDNFVNFCIAAKQTFYLNALIKSTQHEAITGIKVSILPNDYLHYVSAEVGDNPSELSMAKIYLGSDGFVYYYSNYCKAAIILGNSIKFLDNGREGAGILHYYRRPTKIIEGTFQDDFDKYIYNDIIANNAAVIAGMKEIQTQRETKKTKRVMLEMMTNPIRTANYIKNNELSYLIVGETKNAGEQSQQ